MPDITLQMLGDASLATGAFRDIGSAALAAGKVIADFAKESVRAFSDAERVQRQLKLAAGEYTDALNEQADATKKKFAVDDDQIRQMQTLLLRYGAAPAQIKATTEAILDYAAATGKDAKGAMDLLIRGVESGSGSLGKMGVHFQTTGSFAKDLTSAVDALGKKFGGAGEEDAKSLDGRMRSVTLATDDFKKAVGGLFAQMESGTGVLEKMATTIDRMTESLKSQGWKALLDPRFGFETGAERAGLVPLPPPRKDFGMGPGELPTKPIGGDHRVGGEAAKKAQDEFERQLNAENEFYEKRWLAMRRDEEQEKEHDEAILKSKRERAAMEMQLAEDDEKHDDDMLNAKRLISDLEVENEFKTQERLGHLREQADAKEALRLKHQEEQWRQAGDRIGAALVNAIGAQLQRMAEGGDVDPAEMVGDVLSVVLSVAGFAIGSYFGSPQLGGAIGGLAGGLAKTGIVSEFGRKAGKKHDGGAIERYHSGGVLGLGPDEVPLIGQLGENMWSRNDVRNAGGMAAVEAMKRGGGRGLVVNVSAIDSRSFTDSMGREGGRGVFNALRVGRGDLVPLFSG